MPKLGFSIVYNLFVLVYVPSKNKLYNYAAGRPILTQDRSSAIRDFSIESLQGAV